MSDGVFRSQFVPVLWGSGKECLGLARRIFTQWGAVSHVFDTRIPLRCRLTPWIECHSLPALRDSSLAVLALTDFAADVTQNDRIPMLFLTRTANHLDLLGHMDELERVFVVVDATSEETKKRFCDQQGGLR